MGGASPWSKAAAPRVMPRLGACRPQGNAGARRLSPPGSCRGSAPVAPAGLRRPGPRPPCPLGKGPLPSLLDQGSLPFLARKVSVLLSTEQGCHCPCPWDKGSLALSTGQGVAPLVYRLGVACWRYGTRKAIERRAGRVYWTRGRSPSLPDKGRWARIRCRGRKLCILCPQCPVTLHPSTPSTLLAPVA